MEPPIYEVFLVLHPVSSRLAELTRALEPLIEGEPPARSLDVYHRAGADTALIALHFDERALSGDALRRLDDVARGAGMTLLDPARLGAGERRAFFDTRLPQFETCARGLTRAYDVGVVLGDRLGLPGAGLARATPPDGYPRLAIGSEAETRAAQPRLVVHVPPLARPAASPPPAPRASSPRVGGARVAAPPRPRTLPPPPDPTPARGLAIAKLAPRRRTEPAPLALSLAEQARHARHVAEAEGRVRPPTAPTEVDEVDPAREEVSPVPAPAHAADTAPLRRAGSSPGTRAGSEPGIAPDGQPTLDVRFLRGNEWVPVRARALSARGAYIVHGAPARLGDTVHVSVSCAGRTALVRGTVYHVTTAEDARSTGASGFAVRFPEYACPSRTHLVQVLVAARNAGVTLRPPPNRTSVRFPVRWPVQVVTPDETFDAEAQDVSIAGLFLATSRVLALGTMLRFAMPLDLDEAPLEGHGRVARVLDGPTAASRGMREGLGITICALSDADRARWDAFLSRVRRRTEKRVLVGAAPGRVEELAAGLGACGYTVTAGSDLGLLMRVAELDPCPPDLAVIDADFDRAAAPTGWIEQVFASRQVQCVTIQGDVRRARCEVDRLLDVEA